MMQIDMMPDASVEAAARWLAGDRDPAGKAIVPELKTRFGLDTQSAMAAIRLATTIRRAVDGRAS